MEEFIGFGLIGVIAILIILGIKKLFTKKKSSFEYEDEIILDNDMVHYGPFSGSNKNPYRKFLLLLTVSSSYLSATIDMKTIDNWGIISFNETLVMRKTSDSSLSEMYIEMNRPFCICTNPRIITPIGTSNYNVEDKIEATMIINNYKPKKIVFNVDAVFDDTGHYLLKPIHHPGLRNAELIKIKFPTNVAIDDILFITEGMTNAMKQTERICFSDYLLTEPNIDDVKI
tara:strand:- start:334 stop:1020 length:687 start_codon:yes stop_codon:yes gene_type:complete